MIEKCKNNIKEGWKTTIVGIFLLATGIGLLIDQRDTLTTTSSTVFVAMCISGLALLFIPDTFLSTLAKYIKKYSEK